MRRDIVITFRVNESELTKIEDLRRHNGDEKRAATIRRIVKEKWLSIFGHLRQPTEP